MLLLTKYLDDFYLQWDSASSSWQKIGDVVDAVGSGRRQVYEGREYDYVFDVDIKDGVPPLKLPYNTSGVKVFPFVLLGNITHASSSHVCGLCP